MIAPDSPPRKIDQPEVGDVGEGEHEGQPDDRDHGAGAIAFL